MFGSKSYKNYIMSFVQLATIVMLLIGYFIEFISYFLITDSFTFVQLPIPNASFIEFVLFTLLSSVLCLASIWLIRTEKAINAIAYIISLMLIAVNLVKLSFYIPSITFDKSHFYFLIKQYVPLITNSITIFFGVIQISELKYRK